MDEAVALLWALHDLDRRRCMEMRRRSHNDEETMRQELTTALEQAEKREHTLRDGSADIQSRVKQGELDLAALQEQLTQTERHLFDGTITNPKEITQLQHRLGEEQRHQSVLEERYLSLLEEAEKYDRDLVAAVKAAEHSRAELASFIQRMEESRRMRARDDQAYEKERAALLAKIPVSLREKYELIHGQYPDGPLADIKDGSCSGCHTELAQAVVERVNRSPAQTTCENCGRLLALRPSRS